MLRFDRNHRDHDKRKAQVSNITQETKVVIVPGHLSGAGAEYDPFFCGYHR